MLRYILSSLSLIRITPQPSRSDAQRDDLASSSRMTKETEFISDEKGARAIRPPTEYGFDSSRATSQFVSY
jgi:hypothetical protein